MKLGKKPARIDRRTVMFKDIAVSLPQPLDLIDRYNSRADWGMMGNDKVGDCTCAFVGHAEQLVTDNCPKVSDFSATSDQVVKLYSDITGYDPRNPWTDQGAEWIDVFKYVQKNGVFGHDRLIGYAAIEPGDTVRVRQAMGLFGVVAVGLQLPDAVVGGDLLANSWEQTGKIKPNPYNGHAVLAGKWDVHRGPAVITWGAEKFMSQDFWLACADECWVLLFENWLRQYADGAAIRQALENALKGVSD